MIEEGLLQYVMEVTERQFHQPENGFGMPNDDYDGLTGLLEEEEG